ncbi:thiol peroxidase [Chryseobacterium turcicum]|uniref:Thiol peroxidase n=1 Tax=Chryseobacterium turcicum TaxID=2898076 RepID=A0A9Q3V2X7_9FLAO|nr:thiol peroxidase [Chryseobacterium turcicum]MCD1117849.1 thiol peroxidase [Chryseobacterium turcicum]
MSTITFKGNPINTIGSLPQVGNQAQEFTMVSGDLSEKNLADYTGKRVVLNIFPSIDTGICAASARKFNEEASTLDNTVVINVSRDLPFALSRFCAAEGLTNVETLSDFRGNFGEDYGVTLTDSPLKGLLSRAVVVLDEKTNVIYTEQVPEIGQEPNYEAAIASLK